MRVIGTSQFDSLLLEGTSLIDVRAPVEFADGAIPGARNLPLLTDDERRQIGTRYKEQGQDAAVALGHSLVSGAIREERITAWEDAARARPDSVIYCFRGGLRSRITQAWLAERGMELPIVEGGYKALRRHLLEAIEREAGALRFEVICGPTGTGKTTYLRSQGRPFLDLEELAGHRGSAFGGLEAPQPSQVDFENRLALELIRLARVAGRETILIEDESRMIGARCVPRALFERIQASSRTTLDVPIADRVENIFRDYVLASPLGSRGDARHFMTFRRAVRSIANRLGDARTREALSDLDRAEAEFMATGALDTNREWIRKLLDWYYDPVYVRGMNRAERR